MTGMSVFQAGFNDKIVGSNRSLDIIFNYIKENPYRLAIRKLRPSFFDRCDSIRLNGKRYMAYGNLRILKNPFMEAVIIHRRYGEREVKEMQERWLHLAMSGGISGIEGKEIGFS